jgi:hypothetical protein
MGTSPRRIATWVGVAVVVVAVVAGAGLALRSARKGGEGSGERPHGDEAAALRETGILHLHFLCISIWTYQVDHGSMPATLADLVQGQSDADPRWLVDPSDPEPQPLGDSGLQTSFAYVGPLPDGAPDDVIVAYSRPGLYADGRIVARTDCWTEFITEKQLRSESPAGPVSLSRSYGAVREFLGPSLTPERDEELRRFYGID